MNMFRVCSALFLFNFNPEDLKNALVNTVIGLAVVFVALVVISFVISLFKVFYNLEQKKAQNTQPAENNNAVAGNAAELNLDNFALTAVITAAISEYEESKGNTFKNGIVVRSIKKIN